jgi:hypothetical protein
MTDEGLAPPLETLNRLIERNAVGTLPESAHPEVVSALRTAVDGLRPVAAASDQESTRLLDYMHGRWEQLVQTDTKAPRLNPLFAEKPPVLVIGDIPAYRRRPTLQMGTLSTDPREFQSTAEHL